VAARLSRPWPVWPSSRERRQRPQFTATQGSFLHSRRVRLRFFTVPYYWARPRRPRQGFRARQEPRERHATPLLGPHPQRGSGLAAGSSGVKIRLSRRSKPAEGCDSVLGSISIDAAGPARAGQHPHHAWQTAQPMWPGGLSTSTGIRTAMWHLI
jgi:hypothetical protein